MTVFAGEFKPEITNGIRRDKEKQTSIPRAIFVFGSNTEGRHGKGAALEARLYHGAIYGQASGLQGDSYAIITKDLKKGRRSIPLVLIETQVKALLALAKSVHDKIGNSTIFRVTPIGCGLAGYTPKEIAPMFKDSPPNVILPEEFIKVLNQNQC